MWEVDRILCLGILLVFSVIDVRRRCLPTVLLAVCGLAVICYRLFICRLDLWLVFGGVLTGACFLLLSRVTKEGVGYADSLLILILGIYLGLWRLLELLSAAFFLLFLAAVPLLAFKKMSRKYRLPFLPFLTGGCLILFLAEGGIL